MTYTAGTPEQYKNEDIILAIHYRMTSFELTLAQWIEKGLYTDPRWFVAEVRSKDGQQLSVDIIPPQYRNRKWNFYRDTILGSIVSWVFSFFGRRMHPEQKKIL